MRFLIISFIGQIRKRIFDFTYFTLGFSLLQTSNDMSIFLYVPGVFIRWLFVHKKYSLGELFEQENPIDKVIGLLFYMVAYFTLSIFLQD